jgi:aspartate ammonia-lyase
MNAGSDKRIEKDFLGTVEIPANALYGINTHRADENFQMSGRRLSEYPEIIRAHAMVKWAAADANQQLGSLSAKKAKAIRAACQELIDGRHHDAFIIDPIQGGAGTSTNMNANEVIANLALIELGEKPGNYAALHPNNDVNMSQSTNDVYPTALRLATIFATYKLIAALGRLADSFASKGRQFSDILKIGRTQLQDAVPMTLGQEFNAYAITIREDMARLTEALSLLREVNLGGTAIGTGINTDPAYTDIVIARLSDISGEGIKRSENLVEATSDTGAFVMFSGVLKRTAIKLSKIASDLRLLSSGPRAGFGEINLPAVQAGSSIMPGKVNPVIPEVVNQAAYLVVGYDVTISMCAEGGQLQLNAFEPTIGFAIAQGQRLLTNACDTLRERCVDGITANRERCNELVMNSVGIVTVLVPVLGYEKCSELAKKAIAEKRSIRELLLNETNLTAKEIEEYLSPEFLTSPKRLEPIQRASKP